VPVQVWLRAPQITLILILEIHSCLLRNDKRYSFCRELSSVKNMRVSTVDTVCKDRQYYQLNLLNREKLYAKAMSGYRGQAAV
jgi:hypothetical protein